MRKQKNDVITLKKGQTEIELDYAELRKAVLVLRAINHKLRQRIIDLLEENEASQHLAILRRAGVVQTDRSGKFIHYSLNKDRIEQISRLVEELTGQQ